jgi:hypothetical protein
LAFGLITIFFLGLNTILTFGFGAILTSAFFLAGVTFFASSFLAADFLASTFLAAVFLAAFFSGFTSFLTGAFHSVPSSLSLNVPLSDVISPDPSFSALAAALSGSNVLYSTSVASSPRSSSDFLTIFLTFVAF